MRSNATVRATFTFAVSIFFSFIGPLHAADQKPTPITTKPWSEAVVSVSDLDRTAAFFTDIGGYNVRWRGALDKQELSSFGLPAEASGDAVLLGHLDHPTGMIRLVKFENAGYQDLMRPGGQAWDSGCFATIMVRAKNLRGLYDKAIAMGWLPATPIVRLYFNTSTLDVVILRGPDGIQVQAYERLAPALPAEVGDFDAFSRPFNVMQMVKQMDTAYDFYTRVLGFDTFYYADPYRAKEPEFSPLGMPKDLSTTMAYQAGILYPVAGEFGRMELIDHPDFGGYDFSDRCDAPNFGILAVRFAVDDINAAQKQLLDHDWPLQFAPVKASIAPYGEVGIFGLKTPDGALIQFYQ